MAERHSKRSRTEANGSVIEEESTSHGDGRPSVMFSREYPEIHEAVSKAVERATAPLRDALNRSQANQIPSCVDGMLRHLLNLMMGDDIEVKTVVASWEILMGKLPQLLRLNKLDDTIAPVTLEWLDTPNMGSAKNRWAEGCRAWKNAKSGLESRIVGSAIDPRVIGRWIKGADNSSYAKPYDLNTMAVMMAVVRVHHRLNLFKLGDQTSRTEANASRTVADPLASSDLPLLPTAKRTDTYEKWCETNKLAIADGVERIIGCAAIPYAVDAASPSSKSTEDAWVAFDIVPSYEEIHVYRCAGAPLEAECVSAFQRLAADLGTTEYHVLLQRPFDIGGNQRLTSSTSVSGPLAVGVVKILRTLPIGDIIRRSQQRLPARIDLDYIDKLSLAHHLDLINSHTCQTALLKLCRTGKVRIL